MNCVYLQDSTGKNCFLPSPQQQKGEGKERQFFYYSVVLAGTPAKPFTQSQPQHKPKCVPRELADFGLKTSSRPQGQITSH